MQKKYLTFTIERDFTYYILLNFTISIQFFKISLLINIIKINLKPSRIRCGKFWERGKIFVP